MIMHKWNEDEQQYEYYTPPSDGKYVVCASLTDTINCASCGCELECGDAYTSRFIHDGL